ncbi:MAG: hypothetical protein ACPGXK_00640 [Phycisphaerae bacterium]
MFLLTCRIQSIAVDAALVIKLGAKKKRSTQSPRRFRLPLCQQHAMA